MGNIICFHFFDKHEPEKSVKETGIFEPSDHYIYPERFFLVEKITHLEKITIIRVSYPKNRSKFCDIYSINDPLDKYENLRKIDVGDILFLDLIPIFTCMDDNIAMAMPLDRFNPITEGYTYVKSVWGMYNDGGIFTARNTIGDFLIEDGKTSNNTPERFYLERDLKHSDILNSYALYVK